MAHKVVVLGSGPAGLTAALYLSRANLSPLVLDGMQPGGQLTTTTDVDNFPGFPQGIMGPELMENMRKQAERFGTTFMMDEVTEIDASSRPFKMKTQMGEEIEAHAVVVATGASAKYLGLDNEQRLLGYGVSACATCDGFFYQNVPVAVVGGGDTAMEEATFLTKFASKVYILHRRKELRASKIMQERAFANPKIEFVWDTEVTDVLGDKEVDAVKLRNRVSGEESELPVKGFFLGIGHKPNTDFLNGIVDMHEGGYLQVEANRTLTSVEGIFAAGDVTDTVYKQAITSAGSGCKAAMDAEAWLGEQGIH